MKYKTIISFWLLTLCVFTQVRSQTFLENYYSLVEDLSPQEIERIADSLIHDAEKNERFLEAAQLSKSVSSDFSKLGKQEKKSIKYSLLELKNYEALNLFNTNYVASLDNLGHLYYKIKDYNASLKYFSNILNHKDHDIILADTYYNIGKNYYRLGEFFKAEDFYKKSIDLLEDEEAHKDLIDKYFALVRVYNKIRTKESQMSLLTILNKLEHLKQKTSFTTWQQLLHNNYFAYYHNSPETYNFNKSKQYYLKNLDLAIRANDSIFICATSNNLGDLYNEAKNDSALIYLEKSLSYCKKSSFYYTYHQIAFAHLNSKKLDKAHTYIDKSIQSLISESGEFETLSAEDFVNVSDRLNLMMAFDRKAEIYIEQFKQSQDLNDIAKAFDQLTLIDGFIDAIENNTSEEKSHLHWRNEASKIYSKAIYCANLLDRPEKAFYFNEKSKALLLTESILNNDLITNLPEDISNKENVFKKRILHLENNLNEEVKDSLFNLKIAYQNFSDSLKVNFPDYYKNKAKTQLISLDRAKEHLDEHTLVIAYNWDQFKTANGIHGFAFSKHEYQFFTIEDASKLSALITTFKSFITKPIQSKKDQNSFETNANAIYRILFPEELSILLKEKRLIILPDGDLQNLPFEALITNDVSKKYLIESHDLSYAYSMSFLMHNQSIKRTPSKDFIGIAPITFNENHLGQLIESEFELKAIEELIGGDIYFKNEANKSNFLNQSSDSKIIHLATHANASGDPWIAFQDEKLKLHELYTFKNQADLAVLSACETAQGEIAAGEGVMSLARGFFYSGANSVISSLWKVNDKSTASIMTDFYRNIKEGQTKSEALRHAKLNYIKTHSLSEASPYYWSSFILIGDSKILPLEQNNILLFVLISLVIILIFYFLASKLREK